MVCAACTVIFLPAHPASFTHNLVSGMQSFHSGGSQDAMIFVGLLLKIQLNSSIELLVWTHKMVAGPIDIESSESQGPLSPIRMRQKYTRVNILRCVFILRCANQPESKFKLRSHGFYRQEYFCR